MLIYFCWALVESTKLHICNIPDLKLHVIHIYIISIYYLVSTSEDGVWIVPWSWIENGACIPCKRRSFGSVDPAGRPSARLAVSNDCDTPLAGMFRPKSKIFFHAHHSIPSKVVDNCDQFWLTCFFSFPSLGSASYTWPSIATHYFARWIRGSKTPLRGLINRPYLPVKWVKDIARFDVHACWPSGYVYLILSAVHR